MTARSGGGGSKSSEMHAFSISNSRDGFPGRNVCTSRGASVQRYIHTLAINERFDWNRKTCSPVTECKARMGFRSNVSNTSRAPSNMRWLYVFPRVEDVMRPKVHAHLTGIKDIRHRNRYSAIVCYVTV